MIHKKTRIVCTIGPASQDPKILEKLMKNGMNIARLNFSHGTHENHALLIKTIRDMAKKVGKPIAILQDLQGPRIRLGALETPIELLRGEDVMLVPESSYKPSIKGKYLPIQYEELYRDVKQGATILIDEGMVELEVQKVMARQISATVITSGKVSSHKGINVPGVTLSAEILSKKDREDLRFGLEQGVDAIALSFVRSATDIQDARHELEKRAKKGTVLPMIIAKIERREAVDHINEIIYEADGIMIARGDLALECSAAEVPIMQKQIISECIKTAKPVIVATQMLDSMIRNPRPTRAEVSDIANAVIDHTDAVMLSGETASGKYPVEAITMMKKTIIETEKSPYDDTIRWKDSGELVTRSALAQAAWDVAHNDNAVVIAVASLSGKTVRTVSRLRPSQDIIGLVTSDALARQLLFSWGVWPVVVSKCQSIDELISYASIHAKKLKLAQRGDRVVLVGGQTLGKSGTTNFVQVHEI